MNEIGGPQEALKPIDLAREPDFSLGSVLVRPSEREVRLGERHETLEPRVMQVLVALARRPGQVVSRDELVALCWRGRIVGEDAINRCIGQLRKLAAALGEDALVIDTVARVGYRLAGASARPSAARAAERRRLALSWSAGVLAVLIGAVGGGFLARTMLGPRLWTVASARMLIATPLIERHPAISPDGRMIAYSAGPDVLTRQIFLRALAGGEPVRLTDEPGDHISPTWSPDGGRVAYVLSQPGQPCRIMVTPAPAGSAREVGRCQTDERSQVIWAHAGETLFFIDRPGPEASDRIVSLDLATGRRADVTHPPAGSLGDHSIGLSPNGRMMSFERTLTELVSPMVIRDLASGHERVIAKDPDLSPGGWTADSRSVLLSGRVDGDNVIWAFPANGGRPTHLMSGPLQMGRVATGPKGMVAVEVNTEVFNLASPPKTPGGEPQILDPAKAVDGAPAFGPDGTLAMVALRAGEAGIWIQRPGEAMRELIRTPPGAYLDGPSFSPDGTRLAFPIGSGGRFVIRVVSIAGEDVASAPFAGSEISVPTWSADGRAVIFAGRDERGWRVWRADLDHPDRLTPVSGPGWLSVQARDGALYGVRTDAPGVWRIDGTPRRITDLPRPAFSNQWTVAGDSIAYVDDPFGDPPHIMSQPIAGGPARLLAAAPRYAFDDGFAVDPRTGAIVYAAARSDDTDIELLRLKRG
ncbi:MAG: winged helix-turn-helix domain-containing protein [Caulobacteraceae bacterium]|nr:winged helix-turn-helix domain-containing protein [Caulobacteraceae bacterium]